MNPIRQLKSLIREKRSQIGTVIRVEPFNPQRYQVRTATGVISASVVSGQQIKINDVVKVQNQIIVSRSRVQEVLVYYV